MKSRKLVALCIHIHTTEKHILINWVRKIKKYGKMSFGNTASNVNTADSVSHESDQRDRRDRETLGHKIHFCMQLVFYLISRIGNMTS